MSFDARKEAHRFIVCRPNLGLEHNGICDDLAAAFLAAVGAGLGEATDAIACEARDCGCSERIVRRIEAERAKEKT